LLYYFTRTTLGTAARSAIEDNGNQCYVSHATAWEVAIKVGLGKLTLFVDYNLIFSDFLQANNLSMLPATPRHYEALITLPKHHGDPFDRLIIAQAQEEGMTIVTRDGHFSAYSVPLLW
jgi:PIN domain nuclease of toxin-antitoxin system